MAIVLNHATKTQLASRFRERFSGATQHEVWRMAAFIKSLLNSEDITPSQIRNAFGLTVNQFIELASRFDGYVTKYYQLNNAVGE